MPASNASDKVEGFALIFVIWALGIIALIASSLVLVERYRIMAVGNMLTNAEAAAFAESATALGRLKLTTSAARGAWPDKAAPFICVLDGASVAIALEDEGGKVDINAASPRLLSSLLRGFGAEADEAERAAASIVAFRQPATNQIFADQADRLYADNGRGYRPKRAPFETVFELDQVVGLSSTLLRIILPYVTVASHKSGVDPRVASDTLLVALSAGTSIAAGDARSEGLAEAARGLPAEFLGTSSHQSYLVHAEVLTLRGGIASREVVIELGAGTRPDVVKEIRQGDRRYAAILKTSRSDQNQSCYDYDPARANISARDIPLN